METPIQGRETIRAKLRLATVREWVASVCAIVLFANIILSIFVISNPIFTLSLGIVAGGLYAFERGIDYGVTKLQEGQRKDAEHQEY